MHVVIWGSCWLRLDSCFQIEGFPLTFYFKTVSLARQALASLKCFLPRQNLGTLSSGVVTSNCSRGQTTQEANRGVPWACSQTKGNAARSEPPSSPTNLATANLLWNLKNLICQHVSIICSINVRVSGRGQRPRGRGAGGGKGVDVLQGRGSCSEMGRRRCD